MRIKDYYKILNVPTTAGNNEIRKAFRALALQYHPDRNNGDKYKEALFREVQEAYQTLSDPKTREEYNYKRWYTKSLGKSFVEEAVTPEHIYGEVRKLDTYMSGLNDLQVDYDLLSQRIRSILSAERVEILIQYNDSALNTRIVNGLIRTMAPLPVHYIDPINIILARIAGRDESLLENLRLFRENRRKAAHWQKWNVWIVLVCAVLLCWLMYKYAGN